MNHSDLRTRDIPGIKAMQVEYILYTDSNYVVYTSNYCIEQC
jgi:hypothetical protein